MATAVVAPIQSATSCTQSLEQLRTLGLVRLDDLEATALAEAIDGVAAFCIELFGSRTDPAGRGGDIDLLILTDAPRRLTGQVTGRARTGVCVSGSV